MREHWALGALNFSWPVEESISWLMMLLSPGDNDMVANAADNID